MALFKILKWATLGVVGLGVTGFFLFGDNLGSYVGTMAASVKDGLRGEIPIEFELKRAEGLIKNIEPQIHDCKLDVARAEVELESLMTDVDRLEHETARAERKLKTGADVLSSADGVAAVELAGGSYSRERVEVDLERTFESYKTDMSLLRSKKALIERKKHAVAAASQKLDAVRAEEARLKDLIGELKAQKDQVEAMKASSRHFELDDSALGQAKQVLGEVKQRLDVAQKMLEDDLFFEDGIGAGQREPHRDIVREIHQHFSGVGEHGTAEPLVESPSRAAAAR